MSNHEIALELVKLIYPAMLAIYDRNTQKVRRETKDLPDLVAEAYKSILDKMPDRNPRNQSE